MSSRNLVPLPVLRHQATDETGSVVEIGPFVFIGSPLGRKDEPLFWPARPTPPTDCPVINGMYEWTDADGIHHTQSLDGSMGTDTFPATDEA